MNDCYLDDDGLSPEVHVVEASNEEETPQGLCVRVGPVFYGNEVKETGVWIEYQKNYGKGPLSGPVLLTPEVWRQLNRAVERRLQRRLPLRKRLLAKIGA